MFNKILSVFICLILPFTVIRSSHAEPPSPKTMSEKLESAVKLLEVPSDEQQIGEAISPLYKGYRAPFAGVHLSPAAVAFIYVELKSITRTIEIETQKVKAEAAAYHDFEINKQKIQYEADAKVLGAQIESKEKTIVYLEKRLIEEEKNKSNTTLWTGLGFLVGVGLSLLTVYVVAQTVE